MHSPGHARETMTQGNRVVAPLDGIDILPVEISPGIGDTHRQSDLLTRLGHLRNVSLERRVADNVVGDERLIHVDLGPHPDRVELKAENLSGRIGGNLEITHPPSDSLDHALGPLSLAEIFFRGTRNGNGKGLLALQCTPSSCGGIGGHFGKIDRREKEFVLLPGGGRVVPETPSGPGEIDHLTSCRLGLASGKEKRSKAEKGRWENILETHGQGLFGGCLCGKRGYGGGRFRTKG